MNLSRIMSMTHQTLFMSLLIASTAHSAQTNVSLLERQIRQEVARITVLQLEHCLRDDISLNALQFPEAFCKENLGPYLVLRNEHVSRERINLEKIPPGLYPQGREEIFQQRCLQKLTALALQLLYPPCPFDPRKHDPFVCDKALDPYILEQHPELRYMPLDKRNLFFARCVAELEAGIRNKLEQEYQEYRAKKDAVKKEKGIFFTYGFK